MNKSFNNPNSLLTIANLSHSKDNHIRTQMQRVFLALYKQPKTMLMVYIETGILRANICRYVAKWHKQNCIRIVRKGTCSISKSTGVQFLTTNPELFPIVAPLNTKSDE